MRGEGAVKFRYKKSPAIAEAVMVVLYVALMAW